MRSLIIKRKGTKEELQDKLDVFYARNRMTDAEYNELCDLLQEVYNV